MWADTLRAANAVEYEELIQQHRTTNQAVLDAARSLRERQRSPVSTIPVFWAPTVNMLAWRMVERFIARDAAKRCNGSCALICPSNDPQVSKLLQSFNDQLAKRTSHTVKWAHETPASEEETALLRCLNVDGHKITAPWHPEEAVPGRHVSSVIEEATHFSRLRGLPAAPSPYSFWGKEP
jgi:hypothetical protein